MVSIFLLDHKNRVNPFNMNEGFFLGNFDGNEDIVAKFLAISLCFMWNWLIYEAVTIDVY